MPINDENITETTNGTNPYFTFDTYEGENVLVLQAGYRGVGHANYPFSQRGDAATQQELPAILEIPEKIGETPVEALAPGIFCRNNRVREIRLPKTLKKLPMQFCREAKNLRAVHGGENVEEIGQAAFLSTRLKEARFPKLTTLSKSAFNGCAYLEVADIGSVKSIPDRTFANCALLREVIWNTGEEAADQGDSEEQQGPVKFPIEQYAFYHTHSLSELPLMAHFYDKDNNAFCYSKFNNAPASRDFRSGVKFTPCRNRIATKLSHLNSEWQGADLSAAGKEFSDNCALFAVMHIHSAITGQYYSHPVEFLNELTSKYQSSSLNANWAGSIEDVEALFDVLEYRIEVHGKDEPLSSKDYNALVDALAHGAYIYAYDTAYAILDKNQQTHTKHDVLIYGINDLGEVCVLDSYVLHEAFRADGLDPDIDVYTYTIPYTNIVCPESRFIIVYPAKEEADVEWTVYDADNTFTSTSKPSEYSTNRVTICRVTGDTEMPGSKNGILTAYLVGDSAYRTFVPDTEAALYLQYKVDDNTWSDDWKECKQRDFTRADNDSINRLTSPSELPVGVTVCAVSIVDPALPEGVMGYLTAYRLPVDANSTDEIIREEWQPINSNKKYVRYPGSDGNWGNWHFFESGEYETLTESTSGESQ